MDDQNNMLKELVTERLNQIHAKPNEELGQHFLVNRAIIDLLAGTVTPGNVVIEVGPGVGQLTEVLANKASKVISIEIDDRYKPILSGISHKHPNVKVIYEDAIATNWRDLVGKSRENAQGIQIVASLPYHITEPFLHKIVGLSIQDATLLVGEKLGRAVQATSESEPDFSQRTLLTQTFFNVEVLAEVKKQDFFPIPRTDSVILRLTPRTDDEIREDKRSFIFRRLILTSSHSPLVKNCIKEALIELDGSKLLTQNQARGIINSLGINDVILGKSFDQLNNEELGLLSRFLRLL